MQQIRTTKHKKLLPKWINVYKQVMYQQLLTKTGL